MWICDGMMCWLKNGFDSFAEKVLAVDGAGNKKVEAARLM